VGRTVVSVGDGVLRCSSCREWKPDKKGYDEGYIERARWRDFNHQELELLVALLQAALRHERTKPLAMSMIRSAVFELRAKTRYPRRLKESA
jgi:hypothetical protein